MASRLDIKDMREIAQLKGGKCLSKEYINYYQPLDWMCKKGHRWEADYHIIQQGGWCVQCTKHQTNAERLDKLNKIAEKKGGKCLSREFTDWRTKLTFQCKEGYTWKAQPFHIKYSKSWCPFCAGKAKHTISDMQKLAAKRGGKCFSLKYINGKTKLKWQCNEGHIWMARPDKILRWQWCPICRYDRISEKLRGDIRKFQKLANERGGKLVSKEYKNIFTPLQWQCSKRHKWISKPVNIKAGSWCPKCANEKKSKLAKAFYKS